MDLAAVTAVFFDIDGVILDPARTPPEWGRLIGDVLAPALGGTVADWGRVNHYVIGDLMAGYSHTTGDPVEAELQFATRWIRTLCRELSIIPPGDAEAARLAMLTEVHVCTHTTAAFPAASAVIEALRPSYALHTATGNFSWRVDALLTNLGVLDHFEVRSGPDRVGASKTTARFYERTIAAAGVAPSSTLIVDDNPHALELAASIGAHTALIAPDRPDAPFDLVLAGIEELPAALALK